MKGGRIIGFGDVCEDNYHPQQTEWSDNKAYVYPIDSSGIERKWRYARQSVEPILPMLRARSSGEGYQIEIGKTFGLYRSVWNDKRYDSNEWGTKLLNSLIKGSGFTFPKSLWAVYDPIEAATRQDKQAIILDFFAGSATTAHAVMQLNAEDGGNRKFIMVQLPEPCDENSEAYKAGYKTIAEISKERIRRAGRKILEEMEVSNRANKKEKREVEDDLFSESSASDSITAESDQKLDIGFRVLKVDSSNMTDVYYTPDALDQSQMEFLTDNIKQDRSGEDLLFQVLLDWGVDLSLPIRREKISLKQENSRGKEKTFEVFFVDGNALIACFDTGVNEGLVRELAGHAPLRMVFRDSGFDSDAVKINVEQIFRQLSPHTEVRSI